MLQHVTLEIARDRADACVSFWGLLGFAPMEAPPTLRDRFVWVARGETQIHLMPLDDPVVPDQGHTAVTTADYEGIPFKFPPQLGDVSVNRPCEHRRRVSPDLLEKIKTRDDRAVASQESGQQIELHRGQ